MLQDVYQLSEWIANIEPAHSPRFTFGAVLDRDPRVFDSLQSRFKVVDLDGYVRHRCARPAFRKEANLNRHLELRPVRSYPAKVHHEVQAENVMVEGMCL